MMVEWDRTVVQGVLVARVVLEHCDHPEVRDAVPRDAEKDVLATEGLTAQSRAAAPGISGVSPRSNGQQCTIRWGVIRSGLLESEESLGPCMFSREAIVHGAIVWVPMRTDPNCGVPSELG